MVESDEPNDSTPSDVNSIEKLKKYIKTSKGTILIAEIVLCVIIIICYAVSVFGRYIIVAIFEMVSSLIFFIIFALELQKMIVFISLIWMDFFRALTSCLVFIITSLICVASQWSDTPQRTGGVLGILAALLYGYDAYLTIIEIKKNKSRPVIMVAGI
ncbi:hypothetical protein P4O66_022967 [Electrophorus voltai]|uniref:Proteolipid protein 2 n=2 Tax=Electrophorus TaxID=8004 RepID=A0A4W4G8R5_ELEEL|nr:proteolipid protein 2 [Electrophorus electricus]KAK1801283.1 hypothetical protein P4O66_022967 [Electrophorus voltai]